MTALKNGHDDPKVASFKDAQQRAAQKAKAGERAGGQNPASSRTLRDWVIGGTLIAIAIAYVLSLVTPLFSGGG
jgi:hypothetical protein